jgi:hypothetical protein
VSTPDDLRRIALALPGVEETTHFRLPAFRVKDKVFAVLQPDDHVVLHLDAQTTMAATAARRSAVEETRRGTTVIGVRITLAELDLATLEQLTAAAWRHRAPRQLARSTPIASLRPASHTDDG